MCAQLIFLILLLLSDKYSSILKNNLIKAPANVKQYQFYSVMCDNVHTASFMFLNVLEHYAHYSISLSFAKFQ